MRILLDEDVPRRLARELLGYEVSTVQGMGWAGVKNAIQEGNRTGQPIGPQPQNFVPSHTMMRDDIDHVVK